MKSLKDHIVSSGLDPENPPETLVISCHTIEKELGSAMEKTGCRTDKISID